MLLRLRMPRWPGVAGLWPFACFCWARFREDRGFNAAGVLAYATLLSIVPLMAVGLSIFSAFPVFKGLQGTLENFVFQNFVPAAGQVVQQYLQQFAAKATRLTAAGLLVLLLSALMVMATVDDSLNRIWRVHTRRSPLNAFLVYGAVLTWGPVLLGIALGVSSYVMALPLLKGAAVGSRLLTWLPLLLTVTAFTLLYLVVPMRRVRWRHALAGGLLAALLFEAAKRGFAAYVAAVPSYEAVYGAFAAVPVFLIWIYVSWLVILLGAEFAACLHVYRPGKPLGRVGEASLTQALRLLHALSDAQQDGQAMSLDQLARVAPEAGEDDVRAWLSGMQQARLVLRTQDGRYALARDPAETSLLQVYRSGHYLLPKSDDCAPSSADGAPWMARLRAALRGVDDKLEERFALDLKALFAPPQGHEKTGTGPVCNGGRDRD